MDSKTAKHRPYDEMNESFIIDAMPFDTIKKENFSEMIIFKYGHYLINLEDFELMKLSEDKLYIAIKGHEMEFYKNTGHDIQLLHSQISTFIIENAKSFRELIQKKRLSRMRFQILE